ncbi:MAG: formyltransferase family protein [Thermodesulfobacteriota bacterium]|nr:formyltransferase family protein [Thermodesulfobacteriota bacterium]
MSYLIGWFSTGRDKAARDLLSTAYENMRSGFIPAAIEYVFCNRNMGESAESDKFLELTRDLGLKTITFSSRDFLPEEKRQSMERWRALYHRAVMERISNFRNNLIMLAGYMLIVSPEMCRRHAIINLHPAAPKGPAGTWQEVIWKLINQKAGETGVMIHVVTETLDEGPPITYCTFPIFGGGFDPLWAELRSKLGTHTLQELIAAEGESNKLFQRIRQEGVRREIPLIVLTLKTLAEGKVEISGKNALAPYCLNKEIDAYLQIS